MKERGRVLKGRRRFYEERKSWIGVLQQHACERVRSASQDQGLLSLLSLVGLAVELVPRIIPLRLNPMQRSGQTTNHTFTGIPASVF